GTGNKQLSPVIGICGGNRVLRVVIAQRIDRPFYRTALQMHFAVRTARVGRKNGRKGVGRLDAYPKLSGTVGGKGTVRPVEQAVVADQYFFARIHFYGTAVDDNGSPGMYGKVSQKNRRGI